MRSEQPIESRFEKDDTRIDTHPAFGVAVVTRGSGSARSLFQSDLQHNETITLRIKTAERQRHLLRDWTFARKELIEVEMSLAQWGALVSSIGIGSGVPVTIRATEQDYHVPTIPYEPRIAESVAETKGAVSRLVENSQKTLEALEKAISEKKGAKAIREALSLHHSTLKNMAGNSAYAVKSLAEAAESVTAQAKADIESHILNAMQVTGTTPSIEAPSFEDRKQIND